MKERRGERETCVCVGGGGSSLHTPRAHSRSPQPAAFVPPLLLSKCLSLCLVCLLIELLPCPWPLKRNMKKKKRAQARTCPPSSSLPPPARPPALPSRRRRALLHRRRRQQAVQDLLEDGLLELWRCDKREK